VDDFAEFFGARRDIAFRAVLVAVGDRAGAEDAVAEAFARAYQRWPSVRQHPNPTAWVIRTALNASRSWWRRSRREVLDAEPANGRSFVAPPGDPIDTALTGAMAALPRRQREVVALRILADLSAEDTAILLGIRAATVHVHLHRALDSLRQSLSLERIGQ
jgi:RNA polymerase sigma-70 factor (ECF subfamily)